MAERLDSLAVVEFRIPADPAAREAALAERGLAVDAITQAFAESRLRTVDLIRKSLDPEALHKSIETHAEESWRKALLSEPAVEFGRAFLHSACRYLVRLVRLQPDFESEVIWDGYLLTQRMHELLESGIQAAVLPRYREGTPPEHSRFEADYRSDVISAFQMMELFGIDVPTELRQQPIDIAYITLDAESAFQQTRQLGWERSAESAVAPNNTRWRVDEALGAAAASSTAAAERGTLTISAVGQNQISAGPSKGARIILTGGAGSGKTTVAQWLAVNSARRSLPDALAIWNGCIPFLVQLRHIFRGDGSAFPSELDLVRASSYQGLEVPGGWLKSALSRSAALVIFDGLDELAGPHRTRAEVWLDDLIRQYPGANFIVTSRPEGLFESWFDSRAFTHLALMPMEIEDIRRCVESWFNAITQVIPQRQRRHYRTSEQLLLHDLLRKRGLRLLAESPLLCAMLCAFYAVKVVETAPSTQAELYERVIATLIDTRDRVRGSLDGAPRNFEAYDKSQMLQAIARYMSDMGLPTIPLLRAAAVSQGDLVTAAAQPTALSLVKERLASLATCRVDAREALTYLVKRSIVFCNVGGGEAQFSHRTFQEYLAGYDYAESNDVGTLLGRATDPSWRRTITFAARAALPEVTTKLVDGLLDLAEQEHEHQRDLLMLTAECLTAGGRVSREVLERAREAMASIVPPRSNSEADRFSPFGEEILPWLSGYGDRGPDVVAACVRAAARIGGSGALEIISEYSKLPVSPGVVAEILYGWSSFEPREYAERVLDNIDFVDMPVRISDSTPIESVGFARTIKSLTLGITDGLIDFRNWHRLHKLEEIDVAKYWRLESLKGLSKITSLRRLNLSSNVRIDDLSELSALPRLRELYLSGCVEVSDITQIAGIGTLRVLFLDRCKVVDPQPLSSLSGLKSLSLNECPVRDLSFARELRDLRTLRAETNGGIVGDIDLRECRSLRRLHVTLAPGNVGSIRLPENIDLDELHIIGARSSDIAMAGALTGLRKLKLSSAEHMADLGALARLEHLEELDLSNCVRLMSCQGIESNRNLRSLSLSRTQVVNVDFAATLESLEVVNLDGCEALSSVQGLSSLKHLKRLTINDVPTYSYRSPNTSTWASVQCLVIEQSQVDFYNYDPYNYGPGA